jgi:quercetin dioxygenase-like cupin family protein
MRTVPTLPVAVLLVSAFLCTAPTVDAAPQADEHGFVRAAPDQIEWKAGEKGVKTAVIYGDPSKPGLYVVRNTFPPGIMSAPHYHSQDRVVVVIKGTWYTGTDDSWDPATTKGLGPGSYMIHPKGAIHFDGAKDEETVVQITGMGPVETVFSYPNESHMGQPHKMR